MKETQASSLTPCTRLATLEQGKKEQEMIYCVRKAMCMCQHSHPSPIPSIKGRSFIVDCLSLLRRFFAFDELFPIPRHNFPKNGRALWATFSFLCNYEKQQLKHITGEEKYMKENFLFPDGPRKIHKIVFPRVSKIVSKGKSLKCRGKIKTNNKKAKDTRGDHKFSRAAPRVSVKREKRKREGK